MLQRSHKFFNDRTGLVNELSIIVDDEGGVYPTTLCSPARTAFNKEINPISIFEEKIDPENLVDTMVLTYSQIDEVWGEYKRRGYRLETVKIAVKEGNEYYVWE